MNYFTELSFKKVCSVNIVKYKQQYLSGKVLETRMALSNLMFQYLFVSQL